MVCDLVSLNSSQQFSSEWKKTNEQWTPISLPWSNTTAKAMGLHKDTDLSINKPHISL